MEDQHIVARPRRMLTINQRQRMMARALDALAQIFITLANVDEYGALAHEFGGALRRDRLYGGHGRFPYVFVALCVPRLDSIVAAAHFSTSSHEQADSVVGQIQMVSRFLGPLPAPLGHKYP
jgi:hypothetical protein